jgi:hypothetical protein
MKRTDLYKNLASKIDRDMKQAGSPDRFGQAAVLDRKEQRKLDQAKGLIPSPSSLMPSSPNSSARWPKPAQVASMKWSTRCCAKVSPLAFN